MHYSYSNAMALLMALMPLLIMVATIMSVSPIVMPNVTMSYNYYILHVCSFAGLG